MANITIPSFITGHPIFKHYPITKVFPALGLKDDRKRIALDLASLSLKPSVFSIVLDAVQKQTTSKGADTNTHFLYNLVPLQGNYIEFSSNAFDILTISMRGLNSCVRWDGERRHTLVGSIIDPYCGVLYVRSKEETDHGSRMWYRSIVRLVEVANINAANRTYGLYLEKVYGYSELYCAYARWLFRTYLEERTSLPIYDGSQPIPTDHTALIPLSEPVKELMSYDYMDEHNSNKGWVCYRDSGLKYSSKIDCDWSKIIKQDSLKEALKEEKSVAA